MSEQTTTSRIIEAVLFASDIPVSVKSLLEIVEGHDSTSIGQLQKDIAQLSAEVNKLEFVTLLTQK